LPTQISVACEIRGQERGGERGGGEEELIEKVRVFTTM
jgi:hypothetical protein